MTDRKRSQNLANHARLVPAYHFGIALILLANTVWSGWRLVDAPSIDSGLDLLVAIALLGLFWYIRNFPLTVQDRVIRLEMQIRLREILPPDLAGRIDELRRGQLVALRFAGDDEIVELVRWVLDENIRDQRAIKQRISNWRADYLRC